MAETKSLHEQLVAIQRDLKVSKNQYNSFGKYHYRSCEDILEAVKPLLSATQCTLVISDEIVNMGDRYYVMATATISNGKEVVSCSASAREALDKKGMDSAQITGSTSSYARKYALNGLFAIDDTKDSDSLNIAPSQSNSSDSVDEEVPPDPTDDWMNENVEGKKEHYCELHKKDLKERGSGVWDHRAILDENKQYSDKGEWYWCQGHGWHLSVIK